jgi:hypothetical protein
VSDYDWAGDVRFFVPFMSAVDDFTAAMLRPATAGDEHVLPVLFGGAAVSANLSAGAAGEAGQQGVDVRA